MKQLTIAVPSYNMEKLLPQCLESLADERFCESLEVLVVDDGSSDGTARIAQTYAEKWPGIFRVISKENGGHGSAVNAALSEAQGRYFRIVDADDWVHKENLYRLLAALREIDVDVILDEKTEVDMTTGKHTYFSFPEAMPHGVEVPFSSLEAPEFRYHLALHTMSVKRELLTAHQVRLLEHTFYVDSQFVLEATAFAHSAYVFRMGIYFYRVGNAAQSVHYLSYVKRYEEHNRVLSACLDFYRNGRYEPARERYTAHSVVLLAHTQYKIALIYNPDRKQGRVQARALHEKLTAEAPAIAAAAYRRYRICLLLNRLGIGYEGMNRLNALRSRSK